MTSRWITPSSSALYTSVSPKPTWLAETGRGAPDHCCPTAGVIARPPLRPRGGGPGRTGVREMARRHRRWLIQPPAGAVAEAFGFDVPPGSRPPAASYGELPDELTIVENGARMEVGRGGRRTRPASPRPARQPPRSLGQLRRRARRAQLFSVTPAASRCGPWPAARKAWIHRLCPARRWPPRRATWRSTQARRHPAEWREDDVFGALRSPQGRRSQVRPDRPRPPKFTPPPPTPTGPPAPTATSTPAASRLPTRAASR